MTRFTRAKGSKASNERLPNEGTPWHIMKQQLEEALQREQVPQEKTKSARQLLKEKDDVFYPQSFGNTNMDWAEFENSKNKTNAIKAGKVEKKPKDQRKKLKAAVIQTFSEQNGLSESTSVVKEDKGSDNKKQNNKNIARPENNTEDNSAKNQNNTEETKQKVDSNPKQPKNKKRKNKAIEKFNSTTENTDNSEQKQFKTAAVKTFSEQNGSSESTSVIKEDKGSDNKKQDNKNIARSENNIEDNSAKNQNNTEETKQKVDSNSKQPKNKKRKNKAIEKSNSTTENTDNSEQKNNDNKPEDSNTKLSKRQKRNKKKQDQINEPQSASTNIATFNVEGNDWNNAVDTGKRRKVENNQNGKFAGNDRSKNRGNKWSQFEFKNFRRFGENVPKKFQRKEAKSRDDGDHQRRKPDNNVMRVTINGMDVEIVKYDGFPVKKEDAERLKELRKQMVLKGIPKSEIDAAMKLERRKCEKALARIRKQVCFHCRKAGHNLSDCPELGKEEAGTGICFKCGSTEHTHFECKVTKSDDYRYAKCFICREQGHIAKQCPDNPKGLYPDGGGCKICGDVTHLKKDCPDLTKEKEETMITLDTIKDSNLESLDGGVMTKPQEKTPVKKIVKF